MKSDGSQRQMLGKTSHSEPKKVRQRGTKLLIGDATIEV